MTARSGFWNFLVFLIFACFVPPVLHAQDGGDHRAIDWSQGVVQETPAGCGSFRFSNMADKSVYSLVVAGKDGGACRFAQDDLTFEWPRGQAAPVAGETMVYTFMRSGDRVFISGIGY